MVPSFAFAAVAAFNLVCTGTHVDRKVSGTTSEPFTRTFRINLDTKQFCQDECKTIIAISEIQPTRIQLIKEDKETPTFQWRKLFIIDRESGKFTGMIHSENPQRPNSLEFETWDAECTKSAFTGFPKFETKF